MNRMTIASFLPFLVLFLYNFKLYNMPYVAWGSAFVISAFLSLIVVLVHIYKNMVINRIFLSCYIFFVSLAIAFLVNSLDFFNYCFDHSAFFLLGIMGVVGIITTFFSKSGFIGVECLDQAAVKTSSFKLLAAVGGAMIWSFVTHGSYSMLISGVLPCVLVGSAYSELQRKLELLKNN